MGRLIVETVEIEATNFFGLECLRHLDRPIEHLALLLERKCRVEIVWLFFFRARVIFPCSFEERAGDVGNSQLVLLQDALRFSNIFGIEIHNVFVPHTAKLDPLHSKFARGDFTGPAKVLRNFIVNNANSKRRVDHGRGWVTARNGDGRAKSSVRGCRQPRQELTP